MMRSLDELHRSTKAESVREKLLAGGTVSVEEKRGSSSAKAMSAKQEQRLGVRGEGLM